MSSLAIRFVTRTHSWRAIESMDLDNVAAAYEYDYVRRGEDGASATLHRITVTPYAVKCFISDHEFSIIYLFKEDTRTGYRYEMLFAGGIMERHREPLARELRLEGVSAAACNDVVSLLFDQLYPTYCQDQIRNMKAEVVIEVNLMMYDRLDDWEEEERKLRGMTPASGGALEKVRVGPEDRESSCAICLDEFPGGSEATKTPCSHVFHGGCLARWLENDRSTCPLCRFELPTRRPQIWL